MIRIASAAAVAASVLALAASASAQDSSRVALTFETGARTGQVMVALYDSETGYNGDRPVARTTVSASASPVVAVFENLPAGDYAVKSFHDVDGDGRMGTNPFGLPTEPYAFSNNAVGNMGPASWSRARFPVSGDTAQTIVIR
jgi:uncharacterized protein (DUF2141 family)